MTRQRVVRRFERPDEVVVSGLADLGVATVYEAQAKTGLLPAEIRPIQSGASIAGPAATVLSAPGDNLMVHAAVETVEKGDILVIALTQPALHGMVGDLLATSLVAHGCVGLVTDSAVRDSAELVGMSFPVWARGVYSAGTTKSSPGSVNVPVTIGEVEIAPGDVIVADDDGVVVVARSGSAAVLEAGLSRVEKEYETRARLEAGELGVDFYGLRRVIDELGIVYLDDEPERGP